MYLSIASLTSGEMRTLVSTGPGGMVSSIGSGLSRTCGAVVSCPSATAIDSGSTRTNPCPSAAASLPGPIGRPYTLADSQGTSQRACKVCDQSAFGLLRLPTA